MLNPFQLQKRPPIHRRRRRLTKRNERNGTYPAARLFRIETKRRGKGRFRIREIFPPISNAESFFLKNNKKNHAKCALAIFCRMSS